MKKFSKVITILYTVFLGYLLFIRGINYSESQFIMVNFIPLVTIKRYFNILPDGRFVEFLINVVGNIVVFIPFGVIFPYHFKKTNNLITMILIAIFLPVCIEVIQYVFQVGIMDIDDVILNFIGIMIGFLLYRGVKHD